MTGRSDAMNILVVSPHLPLPTWGFGVRVYQLVKVLSRRHAVTLLAYQKPGERWDHAALSTLRKLHVVPAVDRHDWRRRTAQLASLAAPHSHRQRELRSPAMARAFEALTREERFDLIQIESSPMGWFDGGGAPVIIDEHNIESELLGRMVAAERSAPRRLFNQLELFKLRTEERKAWRRASGIVLTSTREQWQVAGVAPALPTAVVPNGVDLDQFFPADTPGRRDEILFIGALNYRPNVDAVLYLVRELLPRIRRRHPGAHLTIVGGSAPPDVLALASAAVTLTGLVPDVRPYLRAATVVAVPLRMGGGTRLKVIEALAMGKAVVSTSLGAEGLDVEHGEHLVIADNAERFTDGVLQLLDHPGLRQRLGEQGRALVAREYSWQSAGQRLEAFYAALPGRVKQVA